MPKRYLCGTDLIDVLEGRNLSLEARYLFRCLLANTYMSVDGLYLMTTRNLVHITGIPEGALGSAIGELVCIGLVVHDNDLLFIPRIPDEQSLLGKAGWWSVLRRSRSTFEARPSDEPGRVNRAFTAFMEHHAALFEQIDSPDFDEAIARSRNRKAAKTQASGGLSEQVRSIEEDSALSAADLSAVQPSPQGRYQEHEPSSYQQLPAATKSKNKNSSSSLLQGKDCSVGNGEGRVESAREGKPPPGPILLRSIKGRTTNIQSGNDAAVSVGDILRSMIGTGRPLHPS